MARTLSFVFCFIAAAGAATIGAAEAGTESRERAARFYAAGAELPLLELRNGARLLEACATRWRRACSKEQRRLATDNRTLALLDELTLFPQPHAPDPAADVNSAAALREKIAATSAALMRAAGDYDRALIARFGAALRVCPGDIADARHRESLEELTRVNLRDFQGLAATEYAAARQSIDSVEARESRTLQAFSADDCDAVLTVGQFMMELMNAKLEPWTRENRRLANVDRDFDFDAGLRPKPEEAPTRELATSIAGNFVSVVATELQLIVFPESAMRIRALAGEVQRAGKADQLNVATPARGTR